MNQMRPAPNRIVRLYQDDDVSVTSNWFVSADGGRYRVSELAYLMIVKGTIHAGVHVSLAIAMVTALVISVMATATRSPVALGFGAPAVVVPIVAAAICARRWPPCDSLRARYHGFEVELFRSRDKTVFSKVARAVTRACEIDREARR
jgi:hypothetical protein